MFYYLKLMTKIKKLIIWLRELRDKVRRNKKYYFIE